MRIQFQLLMSHSINNVNSRSCAVCDVSTPLHLQLKVRGTLPAGKIRWGNKYYTPRSLLGYFDIPPELVVNDNVLVSFFLISFALSSLSAFVFKLGVP